MLMHKGGLIMWPLLVTSLIAVTVAIERFIFILGERRHRDERAMERIFAHVQRGDIEGAVRGQEQARDFVVRTLVYGLMHRNTSFTNALLHAANKELKKFSQGLSVLDTIITLAPLLGLLGTVTGMIKAFGLLGQNELEAPAVITGGIAEALIATAFGLGIAIIALLPFNYLNARMEEARHDLEEASTHLEILLSRLPENKA